MLETQQVKDFSITAWYNLFENITLKTIIIELAPELLNKFRNDDYESEIKDICSEEYVNKIKNAINVFNNEAFVKNNRHAPLDAKFMSLGNTLKVTNVNDIVLYFQSSDIIMEDFENPNFDSYCIAIRPWLNIHPASEFRCIVINNILRGISPRDWPAYYEHYAEEGPNIINKISIFFDEHICEKFPKNNYIFDVFINFSDSVTLMDFGPLNSKTNLYAFDWKEIQALINKDCAEGVSAVFRYLETDVGIVTK